MTHCHEPLELLLQKLRLILHSIPVLESRGYKPPIIDGDGYAHNGDPIIGLRIFKDAVSREVDVLDQFLARSDHERELSTNAPYFVAVWNEILSAPPPIVAVGKVFEPPDHSGKRKSAAGSVRPGGIKVDVVADEGRKWIRVNTVKNSRLLAEFREIDSYLTDSSDDADSDSDSASEPFKPPTFPDNSLLRMGRALAAASTIPIAGTRNARPSVTLRLTRLQPDASNSDGDGDQDVRIAETIDALKGMGLDVQLGERAFRSLSNLHPDGDGETLDPDSPRASPAPVLVQHHPTHRINMDLSMLIALVSDLSHAELPRDEEGAWARFRMPVNGRSWKLGRSRAASRETMVAPEEGHDGEYSKHSRALSLQCLQEMEHGIIDEVVGRLMSKSGGGKIDDVEFWTTEEARERCLQIVEKIGGEDEKRRAHALFPETASDVSCCREEFWRSSRYPASYFPSLLPIHIHPLSPHQHSPRVSLHVPSLFWGHLLQTCRHILSHSAAPHPKLYRKPGEMARAQVTRVNPKLTVHTVESMMIGVCEGMTTLTANKASVRALIREMKGAEYGCEDGGNVASAEDVEGEVAAAIWIVEPRSLAEGMRADRLMT